MLRWGPVMRYWEKCGSVPREGGIENGSSKGVRFKHMGTVTKAEDRHRRVRCRQKLGGVRCS